MPIRDMPAEAIALVAAGTTYLPSESGIEAGHFASREIEATMQITAIVGTDPTLQVTPQYSYDKVTWIDQPSTYVFDLITGGVTSLPAAQTLQLTTTAIYMRFKLVAAGTVFTSAAGTLWAVMKS